MRFIFAIFIFVIQAYAADEPGLQKPGETAGVGECVECKIAEYQKSMAVLTRIDSVLKKNLDGECMGDSCDVIHWAEDLHNRKEYRQCGSYFIDKKGKLGANSVSLVHYISKNISAHKEYSQFMKAYPDLLELCPRFKDFMPDQKMELWTWIFEIIAYVESSCNPNTPDNDASNVPHGQAIGLYQLDSIYSNRSWRGPACKKLHSVDELRVPDNNTACAVDVMADRLKSNGFLFGARDDKNNTVHGSYWYSFDVPKEKKLRDNYDAKHNLVMRDIKAFPLCQTKPVH